MPRRIARLPRDYGLDPETQNLEDGSFLWPSVRQMLGYNSPERRLERRIIRGLLDQPFNKVLVLPGVPGECDLRKVGLLVSQSCVSVSIRRSGSTIIVRTP